ncbi:MAG: IS200/IS605 family transposase [Phycisphaerales bacterium]|nr:IS200/IS605 family transposase [Phycisphaerales bacterium]
MAHTHSKLVYHCVFSTKNRRRLLPDDIRARLFDYLGGILRNHDAHLLSAGGTEDHVHLLVELNASTPIAETMRVVKAVSSKWIHETFPEMRDFGWQIGYGAFTVSLSAVEDVTRYILNQKEHHRIRTFDEEYVTFLQRHGIAYDERFVLD